MNRSTSDHYTSTGWVRFSRDCRLQAWLAAVHPTMREVLKQPDVRKKWLRHGKTWFVGVSALPNDVDGSVGESGALACEATEFITRFHGPFALDRAQVSVCYRGYPRRDANESIAAHRFRINRDAAHVDGLHPIGPERRRHLNELHGFILGIPVNDCPEKAAPLVVWEGSHEVMGEVFRNEFRSVEPSRWNRIDVTDVYHEARKRVWETCARREVTAKPGEAILVHRFALHGIAPWPDDLPGPKDGRIILYFRPPCLPQQGWLNDP